jgi:quinoprotein glucose dehydrogenase
VPQSDVPGEKTWPTQPIPTKPAPYAQQGLVESDLIDYTPAIKDSALKVAQRCRMGPYYIPATLADGSGSSRYRCSWYAPGAGGGVNIDGGASLDPETGMLYVASISPLSTMRLQKDPCSEFRYSSPRDNCGLIGALAPPPGYAKQAARESDSFQGRGAMSQIGGVSILKVKELGGITAYNMNSGDKAWWSPNGGWLPAQKLDTGLFAGVNLPPRPAPGMAQVMTTKTLVVYGTGRSGGIGGNAQARLFAVDKATGKQVGAVRIQSRTTAVPMTFMHEGRQYIVFATGIDNNTSLIALALPR